MRAILRLGLVSVMVVASACGGAGPGSPCAADDECRDDLECIANATGGSQCMARCEAEWLCADGAICLESPSEGPVCWFGGGTSFERACTDTLECEPGTVCEGNACTQACNLDAGTEPMVNPVCLLTERCAAIAAGPNAGVCVAADGTGDAGTGDAGVTSP